MASSLPETAAAQQDTPWTEKNDNPSAVEEQAQPSDRQLSDEQDQEQEDDSAPADPNVSGDFPSPPGAVDGSAEYDPGAALVPAVEATSEAESESEAEAVAEAVGVPASASASASASAAAEASESATPQSAPALGKKPKTLAGFLVGDSDSEDEDTPATATATATATASASVTNGHAPIPASASAQDADDADSYDPSLPTHDVAGAQATPAAPAPAPDNVSRLEARIADDPRGSVDAWLSLLSEHRQNNRFEDARTVYRRFLDLFPQAAEIWVDNIEMELELDNFASAEDLFSKSLTKVLNVPLWVVYLDYVRRRNNLLSDTTGEARTVVSRAYEFVLDNIGLDKESGRIWQDYVQFIRSGPGTIGGSGWQDQQKMDQLRKAFRRATCIPISNVNQLWKEYDQFEMGLNKITGRKFLAERSPAYMSAKSANTALENLTRGLSRTTIPRLPPLTGFDGYQEYMAQVDLWKKWIAWEKSDPLDLGPDEPEVLKARILYCYKQALMPLRFWPEMWVEAAEWCFENNIKESGNDKGIAFLVDGIAANPESILLAFKHADRIESTYPVEEGDEAKIARGQAVRAPYDKIIQTLRDLHKSLQDREKAAIAQLEATLGPAAQSTGNDDDDDGNNDDDEDRKRNSGPVDEEREKKIAFTRQAFSAQMDLVSRCLTHVWIALARSMRRIQGKGSPQGPLGGMRQVFYEARKGGRLKSDIYVAIAKMEWKCYNDKAGGKILERGSKLFPEDAYFMIEYIKYLTAHGDNTNSRVVFETCVNRLAQKPETVHKAKPLLVYMHKREAEYGDLSRVIELEKRMTELYPDDPKLSLFSKRFATEKFDPAGARIIISPAAQLRPPHNVLPSVEKPTPMRASPMPTNLALRQPTSPRMPLMTTSAAAANSPKRPYPTDDFDDSNPPRKMLRGADQREFVRGESPLKGAAGRRLDQQRRLHGQGMAYGNMSSAAAPPAPLPTMVTFLLGQLPPAALYNGVRYAPAALVQLVRETEIDPNSWEPGRKGKQGGGRQQFGRGHARQTSSEFAHYRGSRNSPAPQGGYRQSSLRPDEAYEPPPPTLAAAPAGFPGQYGAPPPLPQALDGGQVWQGGAPGGYGAPGYGQQAPPPQPSQFGTYRFQ